MKNICRETKLKAFQFKLIHRKIVTKKELFRFGIKADDECVYCGWRFNGALFYRMYCYQTVYPKGLELFQPRECVQNLSYHKGDLVRYYCKLPRHNSNTEIQLHRLIYYIYSAKLNSLAISFQDFISKLLIKYNLENLS